MRLKTAPFVLMALIFLSACTTSQTGLGEDAVKMSGEEIKALITGQTFKYWGPTTGTQSWTETDTRFVDDSGDRGASKWWIEGEKYCAQFKQFNKGRPVCRTWYSLGNNVYTAENRKYKWGPIENAAVSEEAVTIE